MENISDEELKMGKKADKFMDKKKYEDALDIYDEILIVNNKSINALMGSASAYLALNNHSASISRLKRCIKIDPDFIPAYRVMVDVHLANKDKDSALDILYNARDRYPDDKGLENLIKDVESIQDEKEPDIEYSDEEFTDDTEDSYTDESSVTDDS